MISRHKIAKTAATFGAAMTVMYTAPELQAQILDLTWDSGNPSATNPFLNSFADDPFEIDIDQVVSVASTGAGDVQQWNDTYGRTMSVGFERNILSATVVALGQTLDPTTFKGAGDGQNTGQLGRDGTFAGTGSAIIGFREEVDRVGWFRMEYTEEGPIIYSDGEYGSGGETLFAGGEPAGGFVTPDTVDVFRGSIVSATLADFATSDDADASYLPGFTIGSFEAPVWLILTVSRPALQASVSSQVPVLLAWSTRLKHSIGAQNNSKRSACKPRCLTMIKSLTSLSSQQTTLMQVVKFALESAGAVSDLQLTSHGKLTSTKLVGTNKTAIATQNSDIATPP